MNKELLEMISKLEQELNQEKLNNQQLNKLYHQATIERNYFRQQIDILKEQFDQKFKQILLDTDLQIDELLNQIKKKQQQLASYEEAFKNQKMRLQRVKTEKKFMYFQKEKKFLMEIVKMILTFKI